MIDTNSADNFSVAGSFFLKYKNTTAETKLEVATLSVHVHFPNFMVCMVSVVMIPRIAKDAKKVSLLFSPLVPYHLLVPLSPCCWSCVQFSHWPYSCGVKGMIPPQKREMRWSSKHCRAQLWKKVIRKDWYKQDEIPQSLFLKFYGSYSELEIYWDDMVECIHSLSLLNILLKTQFHIHTCHISSAQWPPVLLVVIHTICHCRKFY